VQDAHTGSLVRLRAYADDHIGAVHAAALESVAEVAPYETWCTPGYTREQAAEYVGWWQKAREEGSGYYFAVETLESGEYVGSCGLSGIAQPHRRAGLGYWIRTPCTGRGYGTEAAGLVTQLGFAELDLNRVEMEIAVQNAASLRIAEKLGFTREGVLRQRLILPGGPTDMVVLSRLAGEGD